MKMNPYREEPIVEKPSERSPSWFAAYKVVAQKLLVIATLALVPEVAVAACWWAYEHDIHWLGALLMSFAAVNTFLLLALVGFLFEKDK